MIMACVRISFILSKRNNSVHRCLFVLFNYSKVTVVLNETCNFSQVQHEICVSDGAKAWKVANDYNSAKSELRLNKAKRESTLYCKRRNLQQETVTLFASFGRNF